jgi:hypothetical protein
MRTLTSGRVVSLPLAMALAYAFSGCGAAQTVKPNPTTAAEATGAKCDATAASSDVFVLDLPPEKRSDLDLVLGGDLAVVSFTCNEIRVLKTCHASGRYSYRGTSPKERVLSLETAGQIRAALPLGGVGIASKFEGEASTGKSFNLGMVIVGQRMGSASSFSAAELTGDCDGATHVITGAKIGAFAMATSTKAELKTAVQIFGAGAGAANKAADFSKNRDGSIDACNAATSGDAKPPKQCEALLSLDLTKLTEGKAALELDGVTASLVQLNADEACPKIPACEASCNAGKGDGCWGLSLSLLGGTNGADKNIPRGSESLHKGCKLGHMKSCSLLGTFLFGTHREDEAFAPSDKACNVANDVSACNTIALLARKKGDKKGVVKALTKGCAGGDSSACKNQKDAEACEKADKAACARLDAHFKVYGL